MLESNFVVESVVHLALKGADGILVFGLGLGSGYT